MTPMIRRLTRWTLLLALPAALGACAVVPAGPSYGYGPGPGVYVAPPPVVVAPAPVYRPYYGGYYGGYYGRGWGHGRRW